MWRRGARSVTGRHMLLDFDRLKDALAGRYTLERELGQGGMAVVYLALDTKHDRRVALKVLLPELAATVGSSASCVKSGSPPA